jgi:hypothetical protein
MVCGIAVVLKVAVEMLSLLRFARVLDATCTQTLGVLSKSEYGQSCPYERNSGALLLISVETSYTWRYVVCFMFCVHEMINVSVRWECSFCPSQYLRFHLQKLKIL